MRGRDYWYQTNDVSGLLDSRSLRFTLPYDIGGRYAEHGFGVVLVLLRVVLEVVSSDFDCGGGLRIENKTYCQLGYIYYQ